MAMTDWDDLDQFLGDVPDEDFERPAELDADKANRMMRKLRRLQVWKHSTEATADAEIRRIAEWRDGRSAMIGNEIGRITGALEGYMRAVNRSDPKVKTQNLPNGVLRLRAPRTRVVVPEPAIAVNHLLHRIGESGKESGLGFATIDAVLDAIHAEPMLKVTVTVAGGEIGKASEKGEERGIVYAGGVSSDPPTQVYAAVLADGETLPGVELHAFVDDTFTFALSDDTPPSYGDDQVSEDEL